MSSNIQTPAQIKEHSLNSMGSVLGPIYSALWQEVTNLYAKWAQYVVLYGTKSERIDLLNKAAPAFFRLVQDVLWEDIILHIARLTDRPKTSGKANLSIKQILPLISDPKLKTNVDTLTLACSTASEFSRDWRNRHLAHRDLDHAISDAKASLIPANYAKVEEALDCFGKLLNALSQHYEQSETFFDTAEACNDAEILLYVLDDGLKFKAARMARAQNGLSDKSDFSPRNL